MDQSISATGSTTKTAPARAPRDGPAQAKARMTLLGSLRMRVRPRSFTTPKAFAVAKAHPNAAPHARRHKVCMRGALASSLLRRLRSLRSYNNTLLRTFLVPLRAPPLLLYNG
ncbi:hypothetical protein PSPO01_16653 [Paraphaeosphaeria sporulosa]